jgi:glycosyltransferase involved in cell wall biosynthesis
VFYHGIPLLNILALLAYRKITIDGFHPEIIHANVIFPSGLVGYFLSKKYKIPAVLSEHWSGFEHFCHHPLFGRITRKAVSHYKYIMPVSRHLGEIIRKYIAGYQSIIVVPNIVDNKVYHVKSLKKESSRLSFLVVANWQTRKKQAKRPDLVIDALRLFSQQTDKKVLLNVVGEGELLAGIKAECHTYNFDCVFHGYLDKKSINQLLHETDFFLHASNFETFSVVTVEALLTGTPVIVSDLPALRELVNPGNGLLVKNDALEWAEAIKSAVNKEWDHEKIAAEIRDKFTYHIVGQKFTTIYHELTGKSLPL